MKERETMEDFDFGFSTFTNQTAAAEFAGSEIQSLKMQNTKLRNSLDEMYESIVPLLNKLADKAEQNPVINWPNRGPIITKFKEKLLAIKDK